MSNKRNDKRKKKAAKLKKQSAARKQGIPEHKRYPRFVYPLDLKQTPFTQAVTKILDSLDFNDRNQFNDLEQRWFKQHFYGGAKALVEIEQSSMEAKFFSVHMNCLIGQKVFDELRKQDLFDRFIPYCNLEIIPWGRNLLVSFDELQKISTSGGTVYLSRYKPTVMIDGNEYRVGFSRHAIERFCERTANEGYTYAGYGDAHALYGQNRYFEPAQIYSRSGYQIGISFFHSAELEGFAQRRICEQIDPDLKAKNISFRQGYCPCRIEGDIIAANTLLYPGMRGTPEYGLIKNSSLPWSTRKEYLDSFEGVDYTKVVFDEEVVEALRWCHENGIPQVVIPPGDKPFLFHAFQERELPEVVPPYDYVKPRRR